MKYTAEQFAEETRKVLPFKSGLVNLSHIKFEEYINLVVNLDILVFSREDGSEVKTNIIKVKDIIDVSVLDNDTVKVSNHVKSYKIHTKGQSQDLAVALISVLSPE